MPVNSKNIKAISFDYGNTLIEFSVAQTRQCDEAIAASLARVCGPPDLDRLRKIRDGNRMAIYGGDPPAYRENDLHAITRDMIRELYDVEPDEQDVKQVIQDRFDAFVHMVQPSDGNAVLLERLRRRYRLALISNYPDGDAIRTSLERVGLAAHFDVVVVSADVGFVKPHPLPFETAVRALDVEAPEVLHVGDNWLADIQGAKRFGMQCILTKQWAPYERFDPQPGDFEPDAVVSSIDEIEQHL